MRSSTQSSSSLACDACRLRKARCSKERPSCSGCLQNRRQCHYSGHVARSPLTRAYLTSVERRVQHLEALCARLLPDVDLDQPQAFETSQPRATPPATEAAPPPSPFSAQVLEEAAGTPESVPPEADGFDWQEEASSITELTDGMAALTVEPTGHGYLGSTAGVFFLRSLLFWLGDRQSPPSARATATQPFPGSIDEAVSSSRLLNDATSHQVMDKLIHSYFSDYHLTYPFIHEATFRAQYHEIISRPPRRSWQMLFYTVLALGAWCLNSGQQDLDDHLYHCAMSFGEDESMFESANLTFVQALVLLSNLAQKRNKPNTGWNFLGLATRMALSLGLHRALPEWDISLLQREMRSRVWWGLYTFDSGASTTFGRPILLPGRNEMDVRYVLNIEDKALTPRTNVTPQELLQPTIYSGLKAQSDFHVHSNSISNRLLSTKGIGPEEALAMNEELEAWSKTLPKYFAFDEDVPYTDQWFLFARCRLRWRFWNLRTTLFRQLLLRRVVQNSAIHVVPGNELIEDRCREACIDAAHLTVVSINDYLARAAFTRLEAWYSTFFLFQACLVIALAILGDPQSPQIPSWQVDIEMTRNIFLHVLKQNQLAARCANILDRILPTESTTMRDNTMAQFAPNAEAFGWPTDLDHMLGSFGWPDASKDFGFP